MKNDCYKLRELFWPILKFSYLPFRPHWKQHRCTCWNSTTYIRWNISRRYQRYICNCRIKGNPPKRDQIKKCHFLPSCVFRSHGLPSQSVSKLPGWCFSFYLLFFVNIVMITNNLINNDPPSPPQIRPLWPSAQNNNNINNNSSNKNKQWLLTSVPSSPTQRTAGWGIPEAVQGSST